MRKKIICVPVLPETSGDLVFENPVTDTGVVRVGVGQNMTSVQLVAVVPRPGSPAEFPTGAGYRVKFPVVTVPSVSSWLLAQFDVILVEDPMEDPREVTDVRARLHDGSTEFFLVAGVWTAVADPDADWNTLAEIVSGLAAWTDTSIGVVFELSTTQRFLTPIVRGYELMYELDLPDEFNDWLYQTLVAGMASGIRPEKDVQIRSDGATTIDFGATVESVTEDKWDFQEVVGAFNLTDDPLRRVDVLDSFDSGTRVVTLTGAPAVGDTILLRATYAPVVAVTTDQDYIELAATPAILFERVDVDDIGEAPEDHVIMNEFTVPPEATIFPAQRRTNIEVDLVFNAPLTVDLFRLAGATTEWLNERRVLVSPTTGEQVTMLVTDEIQRASIPARSGMRTVGMSFVLLDVYFQRRAPYTSADPVPGATYAHGVTSVQVTSTVGSATVITDVGG